MEFIPNCMKSSLHNVTNQQNDLATFPSVNCSQICSNEMIKTIPIGFLLPSGTYIAARSCTSYDKACIARAMQEFTPTCEITLCKQMHTCPTCTVILMTVLPLKETLSVIIIRSSSRESNFRTTLECSPRTYSELTFPL